MAVYNAAANQVLFSPVTSYYKGKAMRMQGEQATANLEFTRAKTDYLRDELGNAAAQRKAAEEKTALELDQLTLNVEKGIREKGDAFLRRRADAYGPIMDKATEMSESGDIDGAIGFANKELRIAAERLGPDVVAELNEVKGEDGVFDKEELSRFKYSISAFYELAGKSEYASKSTYIGSDGKEYHQWQDKRGAYHRSKILAGVDSEKPFKPPNKQESEISARLIANDKKLSDLDGRFKEIAAQILASDIRQLQEVGKGYAEAAAMAIAGLKAKLKEEPDFITGTDQKIDLGSPELGEGEYKGRDGNIYVEGANGSFRRKD